MCRSPTHTVTNCTRARASVASTTRGPASFVDCAERQDSSGLEGPLSPRQQKKKNTRKDALAVDQCFGESLQSGQKIGGEGKEVCAREGTLWVSCCEDFIELCPMSWLVDIGAALELCICEVM